MLRAVVIMPIAVVRSIELFPAFFVLVLIELILSLESMLCHDVSQGVCAVVPQGEDGGMVDRRGGKEKEFPACHQESGSAAQD